MTEKPSGQGGNMPFKSEAQRRYLWAKEPQVAEKWAHEYPDQKGLPEHVKKETHMKATRHAYISKLRKS